MLKKVVIYGERCSGTNYLEELLITNFDVEIISDYGWKHFFGFNDLSNTDDILFIGIVRNLTDWINSFFREPHHIGLNFTENYTENLTKFLNDEFYSLYDTGEEKLQDRNIETGDRYKNIFELRHVKNKFLVETMPKLVKNYLLITYDDLVNNFNTNMIKIKRYNLPIKQNIFFPVNIHYYKKEKHLSFSNHLDKISHISIYKTISKEEIIEKAEMYYEKILFPNLYS